MKVRLTITNASLLPIRDVRGTLYRGQLSVLVAPIVVATFLPLDVVVPGRESTEIQVSENDFVLSLELGFSDDAGVRWSKYGPAGRLIPLNAPHLPSEPTARRSLRGFRLRLPWRWETGDRNDPR